MNIILKLLKLNINEQRDVVQHLIYIYKHFFTQEYGHIQINQSNLNYLPAYGDIFNSIPVVEESCLAEHVSQHLQQTQEIYQLTWQQSTWVSDPEEEDNNTFNQH